MLLLWPAFFLLVWVVAAVLAPRLSGLSYSELWLRYLLAILVGVPFFGLGLWALVHARRQVKTLSLGIEYVVLGICMGLTYVFLFLVGGLTLAWLLDIQFGD